ncbi:response regulator transcription factor [Clostridium peptidivorans]|uniref:response regulator transcription factor n=1 Tax=Clostridium peptidivorans TaxID=100174 RepID=UPI000BE35852|nr:response regulator transcription factor [Clostridium peptidivorans]
MNNNILIIEDDECIREILTYSLKEESFKVFEASTGVEGLKILENQYIELIILDLMLPDISGFEICKKVSLEYKIPIIMLTAKNDIMDKVVGLELGADDYITKPFDIREVVARAKVSIRRIEQFKDIKDKNNAIKLEKNITIFKDSYEVFQEDKLVNLTAKEYELLYTLAENRGKVFSRDKLLETVWGFDFEGESRTVDVHIQRLRKKLSSDKDTSVIKTVFGVGYKVL